MKKAYKAAETEIVRFGSIDTVTESDGNGEIVVDKLENEDEN